jgi:hypothetical protein
MIAPEITRVLAALPIVIVVAILRVPRSPAFRLLAAIPARAGPLRSVVALNAALGAALIVRRLAENHLILRVVNFVIRTKPEVFDKAMAAAHTVTALVIDRYVDKAALCLGRWAAERHFGSNLARPDRLDDRFEIGNATLAPVSLEPSERRLRSALS